MAKIKYKVGQVMLYLDKKKLFEVVSVSQLEHLAAPRPPAQAQNDVLYTVMYLPKPTEGKPKFGRYYQSKLDETCITINNTDMAQILYGIKI